MGLELGFLGSVWLVFAMGTDSHFITLGQYDVVAVKFGVFLALTGTAMSLAC